MPFAEDRPLRLALFDRTCNGVGFWPGLSDAWALGAELYGDLRRLDGYRGVASWEEGFAWLAEYEQEQSIGEIQFWGHGKWGEARIGRDVVNERTLLQDARLAPLLGRVRRRLLPEARSTFWFRTCETVGAHRGQSFARAWSDYWRCRTAGHTYIIGYWQSGLHTLSPGDDPDWSPEEGLRQGDAAGPRRALWSTPWAPNTISCLSGTIPAGY
jgi:hypothetical protein